MRLPKKFEKTKVLAVEGQDECNFFGKLLEHESVSGVQVFQVGGVENFNKVLPELLKLPGYSNIQSFGFVRDADKKKADSAFTSICNILKKCNLPIPTEQKFVKQTDKIRIAVFVMPDNSNMGMLEDLCLKSLTDNPIMQCVNQYMTCCNGNRISDTDKIEGAKAKVQTYLATKKPIVNSLGLGAQKGYWDFDHVCFNEIKEFIHELFD